MSMGNHLHTELNELVKPERQNQQVGHFAKNNWDRDVLAMQLCYGLTYIRPAGRGQHFWESSNGEKWQI